MKKWQGITTRADLENAIWQFFIDHSVHLGEGTQYRATIFIDGRKDLMRRIYSRVSGNFFRNNEKELQEQGKKIWEQTQKYKTTNLIYRKQIFKLSTILNRDKMLFEQSIPKWKKFLIKQLLKDKGFSFIQTH